MAPDVEAARSPTLLLRVAAEAVVTRDHTVASGHVAIREDANPWFEFDGNPNVNGESSSSGGRYKGHDSADKPEKLPRPAVADVRRVPTFLAFSEQEEFENNTGVQGPQIDEMNDTLVTIYESIAVLRKRVYEMMCTVARANDPASQGKEIGEEANEANELLKKAEKNVLEIKDLGGEPVSIPDQFYLEVKPQKR